MKTIKLNKSMRIDIVNTLAGRKYDNELKNGSKLFYKLINDEYKKVYGNRIIPKNLADFVEYTSRVNVRVSHKTGYFDLEYHDSNKYKKIIKFNFTGSYEKLENNYPRKRTEYKLEIKITKSNKIFKVYEKLSEILDEKSVFIKNTISTLSAYNSSKKLLEDIPELIKYFEKTYGNSEQSNYAIVPIENINKLRNQLRGISL